MLEEIKKMKQSCFYPLFSINEPISPINEPIYPIINPINQSHLENIFLVVLLALNSFCLFLQELVALLTDSIAALFDHNLHRFTMFSLVVSAIFASSRQPTSLIPF